MNRFFFVALALLIFGITTPAHADEDGRTDVATEALIEEGIALRRSGKDEAALNVFLNAEQRAPTSVRVLLHVTTAAQATGKWLLAHQYLQKAALYREDAYYQRHRASIRTVEEAIAQHVGRLRVVGNPVGAEVLVNGERIGMLPLAEPKVLETGSYILEVRKAGYFPLRRPISVGTGLALSQETTELKVSSISALPASSAGASVSGASGSGSDAAVSPLRSRWITVALAGTSVGLLATSAVAFVARENEASHWNDDSACLDPMNPSASREDLCGDSRSDAKTAQTVGIVTGALGLGFGGAAVAHFIWSAPEPTTGSRARPSTACAFGIGSFSCRGSFQ